jgi:hypothetical protein
MGSVLLYDPGENGCKKYMKFQKLLLQPLAIDAWYRHLNLAATLNGQFPEEQNMNFA